ncbi:unnamed protein product [Oikopleura dioica]|uniref:HAT C-terminal dimerisation domain-containing protein n=1 Tax=Oikopleura dioica TaxID=34765 RepID=E4Z2Q4_OIKDI|nr:unnamed protein product [Oikopleura dioica]
MAESLSKKRKLVIEKKLEIKKGEFYELDDIIEVYQNEKKWCKELKFFKIIHDEEWNGQIVCSGECLKPEPIQARHANGRLRNFNLKRHMEANHDPEKILKAKEKRLTKMRSTIPSYFRPAKAHKKEEKKEAAALLTAVAAKNHGAQNGSVTDESFKSLYPSAYFADLAKNENVEEMLEFLKAALPVLIEKNVLSIVIDDKCISNKLSDLEKNCHGTLLQIPDPQTGDRVSYLIGFTPTDAKDECTLAALTRADLKKYGIDSYDLIRTIPISGDAAELATLTNLSLLSVICICHTINRVGEMTVDYAAPYGLRTKYEKETQEFLQACKKQISATNSIRWSKKAEQYVALYLWKSKIEELATDPSIFHKYLLEDKTLPSWTYIKCQAMISVVFLSAIRNMERNDACLPDGFYTIENLMIKLSSMAASLKDRDEIEMMDSLTKGAFAKICNMFFSGYILDDEVASRPDPNRAQEANLVACFLFPPKRKCQFTSLVAILKQNDDDFFKKSGKLIENCVRTWYRHAESATVELYKLVCPEDPETFILAPKEPEKNSQVLDDFDDIGQNLDGLLFETDIQSEVVRYKTSVTREDWLLAVNGKVQDDDPLFASKTMKLFWNTSETKARYPRLRKVALKCLSCPVASAQLERVFGQMSDYSRDPKRNRLTSLSALEYHQFATGAKLKNVAKMYLDDPFPAKD